MGLGIPGVLVAFFAAGFAWGQLPKEKPEAAAIDFQRQVRPILSDKC